MKKLIYTIIIVLSITSLTACNRQIVDITYKYDYAVISLPNGEVVEGRIESWRDYDDGDQIQVKIAGKTYLVHSINIALINQ